MNSIVTVSNGQAVTTTLAIASGTGVEHKNVLALVRTYKADLEEFGLVAFETRPRPEGQHGGADVEFSNLNEQQSTLILTYMRNSDIVRKFKKALVKEFFELAKRPALSPANLTRMQLLEMAMQSEQERLLLEEKIEEQAPKVAGFDRIATSDGMLNLQAAGKALQQQPNKFINWLREHGWIFKRAGSAANCARAEKFNAGYLTTKATTIIQPDGTERVREQVMITPKGLAKLALLLGVMIRGEDDLLI